MRKLIRAMFAFLLCLSLLCGCGKDYELTTYLTSTSHSMDVKLSVSPIWTKEKSDAPQQYTVEFQGNTYTGTYSDSYDLSLRSSILHKYMGEDYYFAVQADTGKLVVLSFRTTGFSEKEVYKQDAPNPEKNAIEIAENAASEYIDTKDYVRTVSSDVMPVDIDGKTYEYTTYSIKYCKEICGISTADTVSIYVTSKGTLKSVVLGEIGAFDHIKRNDISLEKVEASIQDKLIEIERQTESYLSDGYEILEHSLYLTPKKEPAVVTRVLVRWKEPTGDISRHLLQMTTLLQ